MKLFLTEIISVRWKWEKFKLFLLYCVYRKLIMKLNWFEYMQKIFPQQKSICDGMIPI